MSNSYSSIEKLESFYPMIRMYQHKWPIDILKIAGELGLAVYKGTNTGQILSGKIVKDSDRGGKSGYAIYVNAKDAEVRQRFTIAHEIAHFLLHENKIGDGIVDDALYRSGLSNKEEAEANKLAAEILMPWHLINSAMNKTSMTISDLAEMFQVSESAMSIRLGVPC